jgi:phosphopantetheinyl transferase
MNRFAYVATRLISPEAPAALPWQELRPEERALLGPGANRKRRSDFLAGRLAAKEAVAALLSGDPDEEGGLLILRESGAAAGRPYVVRARDGGRLGVQVSISHADGLAVAAAARRPVGLDLVTIEPLGTPLVEDAFQPGEVLAWAKFLSHCTLGEASGDGSRKTTSDFVICAAFAAKEAALKWIGCGLRVPLQSVLVTPLFLTTSLGTIQSFIARVCQDGPDKKEQSARLCPAWIYRSTSQLWVMLCG